MVEFVPCQRGGDRPGCCGARSVGVVGVVAALESFALLAFSEATPPLADVSTVFLACSSISCCRFLFLVAA